jgi:hypothetical protein
MSDALIESGLAYCTAHNGVIDCDEDRCDFIDLTDPEQKCPSCKGQGYIEDGHGGGGDCEDCDGDGITPCTPTPLLYADTPASPEETP